MVAEQLATNLVMMIVFGFVARGPDHDSTWFSLTLALLDVPKCRRTAMPGLAR